MLSLSQDKLHLGMKQKMTTFIRFALSLHCHQDGHSVASVLPVLNNRTTQSLEDGTSGQVSLYALL